MTALLRSSSVVRAVSRTQAARFSVAARKMAGGDTGASRAGGAAQGDAFTKREEASENLYIRQQEAAKLKELKAKLAKQQQDLEKSQKDIEELEKKGK